MSKVKQYIEHRPLEGVDIADAVHKIRGGKHSHRVSRSVRDRLLRAVDAQILDIRNLGQCFRQRRPAQDLLHRIHQRIVGNGNWNPTD